jgi:hypothetical protein
MSNAKVVVAGLVGIVLSLFAGCGDPSSERVGGPLPACADVCPRELTCDAEDGWSCATSGEACQDLKPCGETPPDCEVVCPDVMVCDADEEWTCGRPDLPCLSDALCP